jgi:hypothetical protein
MASFHGFNGADIHIEECADHESISPHLICGESASYKIAL